MAETDIKTEEYLARIRKTIAESERLVESVRLRMAETDRLLESQGLTREQVLGFKITPAQREAADRELVRRGFAPFGAEEEPAYSAPPVAEEACVTADEFESRRRKFGMMMKPFQI